MIKAPIAQWLHFTIQFSLFDTAKLSPGTARNMTQGASRHVTQLLKVATQLPTNPDCLSLEVWLSLVIGIIHVWVPPTPTIHDLCLPGTRVRVKRRTASKTLLQPFSHNTDGRALNSHSPADREHLPPNSPRGTWILTDKCCGSQQNLSSRHNRAIKTFLKALGDGNSLVSFYISYPNQYHAGVAVVFRSSHLLGSF